MPLQHGRYQQHVRAFLARLHVEVIADPFLEHARCEGAEALAEFDLQVQGRLHRAVAGIAENAARPKGARSELHTPMEPAHDLAFGQHPGNRFQQPFFLCKTFVRHGGLSQKIGDVLVGIARAQQAAFLAVLAQSRSRFVHQLVPDKGGGAQRAARIPRRRLNPETLEGPFAQQQTIGNTIEGHAAGQHEVAHPGLALRLPRHAQHHFFGDLLDAGGHVHVPLRQHRFGTARRAAEKLVEPLVGHGQPLAVIEIIHVHPETAVGLELHQAL